ncbi:4-hydroxyphenylacetate 3-hydroxylase N-terminal domain-containing protein [Thermodesulfobacteriota bacterium]
MAIRSPEQYLESLRDGRVVYSEGKRVEDVTRDPLLSKTANSCAWDYAIAQMPEYRDSFVTVDEHGEDVSFVFIPAKSIEDLFRRREIIQILSRICFGTPGGAKFTGIDALNSLTVNAKIMDSKMGTQYSDQVEAYRKHLLDTDAALVVGMTDVKGDRSLRPSQQKQHPDYYVRIVDHTKEHGEDGIVVRGAKMFVSLAACANEIIIMPSRAMTEEDKDYALAFTCKPDTKGITIITSTEEEFEPENDFEFPIATTRHSASGAMIFDDVFIPMDRVFLKGEWQYSANFTYMFANFHRMSGDAYKYACLEIMAGLGALLAEYNGLEKISHIRDKLAWLALYAEGVEALGKAACQFCVTQAGTDLVYPNPTYSNIAKFYFADHFHQAVKILQDIAGGLPAAAFSAKDYFHPELRPMIDKYFSGKEGSTAEQRLRAMHLCREITSSFEGLWTIHAEGSLAAQRLSLYALGDWEQYKAAAKRAARIEDGTEHPIFSNLPEFPQNFIK